MTILYVCTGNTCRSPMAQEITRLLAAEHGKDITALSAGVYAQSGALASEQAQAAILEAGGNLSEHAATELDAELLSQADIILCMGKGHLTAIARIAPDLPEGKAQTLSQFAFGQDRDIQDPFGGDDGVYRDCLAQIAQAVKSVLEKV